MAVAEFGRVEIDERPKLQPGGPQVRTELRGVDFKEPVHRLQLDDEAAFDQQIESMLTDFRTFVGQLHDRLSCEPDPNQPQLGSESLLVNGLDEARSKCPMNLDRGANHAAGDLIRPGTWFGGQNLGTLASWRLTLVIRGSRSWLRNAVGR